MFFMSDIVIKIENLYKEYRLGVIGHGTLYRDLQSWWATARGKEDPNSLIGHSSNGQAKDHILALKDINLEVKEGEVLGIIGANAAGKSTLLKILSRVTAPTKGTIKIKGRVVSLLEVGTGFHSELTGRENIYLNGTINGMDKNEVTKKLDEIAEFAGVEQFLDTPVKRYSSGMFVRLGFAVAAHLDPDILVVDEVLAVGDEAFQKKAIGKMHEVSEEEGRTVLFVSHNMQSISSLCNNAILLNKGSIIIKDDSQSVINEYLRGFNINKVNDLLKSNEFKRDINVDGSVRFTKFKFLNDNGGQCDYYNVGDKVVIYFKYKVMKDIKVLNIVGGFALNKNYPLVQLSHRISDTPLKSGHEGEIKITIEPDCVLCGEFLMGFFLRGGSKWENYDYLSSNNLPRLRITNKNITVKTSEGDLLLDFKHTFETY